MAQIFMLGLQKARQQAYGHLTVLLGIALTALATILIPNWFTTSSGHSDPWIYWGTAEAVNYSGFAFGGTYYFRRWTLWVPQALVQRVLAPLETQFVLRSLILVGIFALIVSIATASTKSQGGLTLRLVVALSVLSSTFFIFAWSTTYHEGLGSLLFLAAIRVAIGVRSRFTRGTSALFGSLLTLLFVTYQFTALLVPALAWLYGSAISGGSVMTRIKSLRLVWLTAGATGVMVLDAIVGRIAAGGWDNLLIYTWRVTLAMPSAWGASRASWLSSFTDWSGSIVIIWALATAAFAVPRLRDARLAGFFGLVIVPYAIDFIREGGSLFWPHMNIYLYVTVFLALLVLALRHGQSPWAVVLGLVAVVSLNYFDAFARLSTRTPFLIASLGLVVAVVASSILPKSLSRGTQRAGIAVGLLGFVLGLSTTPWIGGIAPSWDENKHEPRSFYEAFAQDHKYITEWGENNSMRMFLIDARPHAGWSTNVSALYGMYSGLRLGFNGPLNCSWVAAAASPSSAIAVIGDYVAMITNDSPSVSLNSSTMLSGEPLGVSLERTALDQDLRACDGVAPWSGEMVLLDMRTAAGESASIRVYGYR